MTPDSPSPSDRSARKPDTDLSPKGQSQGSVPGVSYRGQLQGLSSRGSVLGTPDGTLNSASLLNVLFFCTWRQCDFTHVVSVGGRLFTVLLRCLLVAVVTVVAAATSGC